MSDDEWEYIRVQFKGMNYIWIKDKYGEGSIAPLEHFTSDGSLDTYHALISHSFAHVTDGEIWRHGECIGAIDDLVFI